MTDADFLRAVANDVEEDWKAPVRAYRLRMIANNIEVMRKHIPPPEQNCRTPDACKEHGYCRRDPCCNE